MKKCVLKNNILVLAFAGFATLAGCKSGYSLVEVEGSPIPVTAEYEAYPDMEAEEILCPYKLKVDSMMLPVIGHSAANLTAKRPESPLSNLIADVLRGAARPVVGREADVAVMNMGGIRNALPKGDITFGTIYEIAPFENALCLLTMDGATLEKLFEQIAAVGGEGLSGANLTINNGKIFESPQVNGKFIDPKKEYIVATIDYLAEGNDRLSAFREAKSKTVYKDKLLRNLLLDYVKEMQKKGKAVDAKVEGRIQMVEIITIRED